MAAIDVFSNSNEVMLRVCGFLRSGERSLSKSEEDRSRVSTIADISSEGDGKVIVSGSSLAVYMASIGDVVIGSSTVSKVNLKFDVIASCAAIEAKTASTSESTGLKSLQNNG